MKITALLVLKCSPVILANATNVSYFGTSRGSESRSSSFSSLAQSPSAPHHPRQDHSFLFKKKKAILGSKKEGKKIFEGKSPLQRFYSYWS
ncbi:hypothetical protein I3842_01G173300 [Carya illinoinensis]|uniref:Secreted protein n=1 Tax=Carya illinoinensis TaxID=32201 RepID=A0A922KCG2_CARIL|nr:hypothetical protein I3842_01G173300 [Carya illinoinensis]